MDDLISRQAAIDTLATGEELLRRVLDDMDVVGNEREKYEWGLGLIESYIADMKDLPSSQPEIIRCKDCKYYTSMWYCEAWSNSPGFPAVSDDMFCSLAERRDDE